MNLALGTLSAGCKAKTLGCEPRSRAKAQSFLTTFSSAHLPLPLQRPHSFLQQTPLLTLHHHVSLNLKHKHRPSWCFELSTSAAGTRCFHFYTIESSDAPSLHHHLIPSHLLYIVTHFAHTRIELSNSTNFGDDYRQYTHDPRFLSMTYSPRQLPICRSAAFRSPPQ